ncbi:MAG: hypothetical protein LBT32_06400 [Peptococcaceae bacterium]|jgi:hypothetical protein|nr:hypothetical protein [Peptococcaceae bacterium]
MMTTQAQAPKHWQEYRFLTREMEKFIDQDLELFYALLNQRGELQSAIEKEPDDIFPASLDGQEFLREIAEIDQQIAQKLQSKSLRAKRQHQVAEAYSGSGQNTAPLGQQWKR